MSNNADAISTAIGDKYIALGAGCTGTGPAMRPSATGPAAAISSPSKTSAGAIAGRVSKLSALLHCAL